MNHQLTFTFTLDRNESQLGEYDDAIDMYNRILEKNGANQLARKRIVAVYRAQGKYSEAIEQLNLHLKRSVHFLPQHSELSA